MGLRLLHSVKQNKETHSLGPQEYMATDCVAQHPTTSVCGFYFYDSNLLVHVHCLASTTVLVELKISSNDLSHTRPTRVVSIVALCLAALYNIFKLSSSRVSLVVFFLPCCPEVSRRGRDFDWYIGGIVALRVHLDATDWLNCLVLKKSTHQILILRTMHRTKSLFFFLV